MTSTETLPGTMEPSMGTAYRLSRYSLHSAQGFPAKEHGLNSSVSDYFVWVRAKIIKSYVINSS